MAGNRYDYATSNCRTSLKSGCELRGALRFYESASIRGGDKVDYFVCDIVLFRYFANPALRA